MIPGDGIGPELMLQVQTVFRRTCVPVGFEVVQTSSAAGEEDFHSAIMSIRRNRVATNGHIEMNHNLPPSHRSLNSLFRTTLDLYANVIHFKSLPGVRTRHGNLAIWENTEGEYSNLEYESVTGVMESLKIITEVRSLRVAEHAFQLAQGMGRRKVTAMHNTSIMKLGDDLFLQCCREVASAILRSPWKTWLWITPPCKLVSQPQQFDVMVMPNLYGNIVNSVCTGLVGGPGIVPCACYGPTYAMFETAAKPSGRDIANKNMANRLPRCWRVVSCWITSSSTARPPPFVLQS